MEMTACPCGYGSTLEYCCKPFINGAPTAEALMRPGPHPLHSAISII
jgi:uncharacterized protein YchJ